MKNIQELDIIQKVENRLTDFTFSSEQNIDFDRNRFMEGIKNSRVFSLLKSFDGYVSDVLEQWWKNMTNNHFHDKSKSSGVFNFHADGLYYKDIPEIIWLYCVDSGYWDANTYLIDTKKAIKEVSTRAQSVLQTLQYSYIWRNWQHHPRNLLEQDPLASVPDFITNLSARGFISPLFATWDDMPEIDTQNEAIFELIKALKNNVSYEHTWKKWDMLLLNNNHFLHGRSPSIYGVDVKRHLVRFWLRIDKLWV